jgi:phosphomannomutase
VPDEFDPAEAYHIGRAYALHTGAEQVVVARDMRPSGDLILPELLRGLKDGGVDVILIGQATTPLFYFAIHHLKAEGGLMVTASHNPGAYNGIKMARAAAVPIGGDSGLMEIRDLVQRRVWPDPKKMGSVREESVLVPYVKMAPAFGREDCSFILGAGWYVSESRS